MYWYHWVLIGVGVIGVGVLKVIYFNKWQAKKTNKNKHTDEENDED
ncbi:MAG: hypothetical protein AB7V00_05520 [Bacilli bacterium]